MDVQLWKLLVEKAILRTKSRDLLWSKTSEGPNNAVSFGAPIDDSTTLNIWGHKTNYSYELLLTKELSGETFEERKRVTAKKDSEGIDFKGLLDTVQAETQAMVRENVFAAVMEYLDNPAVEDPETQEKFRDRWSELGDLGYFLYSQDEKILTAVRDMTAEGSISWTAEEVNGRRYFGAKIGELLDVRLEPSLTKGRFSSANSYTFEISGTDDEPFYPDVRLSPDPKERHRPVWLVADELHTLISEKISDDKDEFNKIVRNSIVHDILSALDAPPK